MHDDRSRNVEQQARDDRSILQLYRSLITLRRHMPCLVDGDHRALRARNDILQRVVGRTRISVGLNTTGELRRWDWANHASGLISTHRERSTGPILLRAIEGVMVQHVRDGICRSGD